jgi:SnoaL-like domain
MNTMELGQKYVALCKEGKFEQCLEELFSEDAISVEAWAPPGAERTTSGLPALRSKSRDWARDNEVHRVEALGPFPNDHRFAVIFRFEVTHKPSGRRNAMEEVGLFTVESGKITLEEFFYSAG